METKKQTGMMELENVSFKIKGRTLLHHLSLQFCPGTFWGIVGANGAGKSTLLKLLAGEHQPSTGRIIFRGRDMQKFKRQELAQHRAVLAQQNSVELDFTVQEIVTMGRYPYYQSSPTTEDLKIIQDCMQKVGVDHFGDRLYPTLSGGEQQRVQLARALAQIWEKKNAFLILDEPTTGMDLLHQYQTFQLAKDLSQQGFGVVAVVHDLNLASQYTDQTLLLKNGKIHESGPTKQVLTENNIQSVFGLPVQVIQTGEASHPFILPKWQSALC